MKWRGIKPSKSNQRRFVFETPDIANFSNEPRPGNWSNTIDAHHCIVLREHTCQSVHFGADCLQRIICSIQHINGLHNKSLCAFAFGQNGSYLSGRAMDLRCICIGVIISLTSTPSVVGLGESFKRNAGHTIPVPEAFTKINPFEMSRCCSGCRGQQLVDAGKGLLCERHQSVSHHDTDMRCPFV